MLVLAGGRQRLWTALTTKVRSQKRRLYHEEASERMQIWRHHFSLYFSTLRTYHTKNALQDGTETVEEGYYIYVDKEYMKQTCTKSNMQHAMRLVLQLANHNYWIVSFAFPRTLPRYCLNASKAWAGLRRMRGVRERAAQPQTGRAACAWAADWLTMGQGLKPDNAFI